MAQVGVRRQQVDRRGVVNARLDVLRAQSLLEGSAVGRADGVDVIDVADTGLLRGRADLRRREPSAVLGGVRSPRFGPGLDVTQLDPQDCRLQLLETEVEAL